MGSTSGVVTAIVLMMTILVDQISKVSIFELLELHRRCFKTGRKVMIYFVDRMTMHFEAYFIVPSKGDYKLALCAFTTHSVVY